MSSNDNPFAPAGNTGYATQTVELGGGPPPGAGGPAPGGALIKDTSTAEFQADVIAESRNQPVLIDFWAPWCGPCKQLTPVLEAQVQKAGGKVKLVKMNIDEHPAIPGQMGIQSIPAVLAFVDGQPVDGFMGAQPESQVAAFIDKLVKTSGGGAQGAADQLLAIMKADREWNDDGARKELLKFFEAWGQTDPATVRARRKLSSMLFS